VGQVFRELFHAPRIRCNRPVERPGAREQLPASLRSIHVGWLRLTYGSMARTWRMRSLPSWALWCALALLPLTGCAQRWEKAGASDLGKAM
jgi:hypothetical protein